MSSYSALMDCSVHMSPATATATADVALNNSSSLMPTEVSDGTVADTAPIGSAALYNCLDLLVKAQKTQSESVTMLRTLHERFFPSLAAREDAPAPAVPFDDTDRTVVRLRVAEMKLSGIHPRLSDAIDGAVLPFQSYIRSAAVGEVDSDAGNPVCDACRRVSRLRDQLMGLAQLQGEALRSLGAQLSTLFARPRGGNVLYYYPNTHDTHGAVREFLQQLLDVMSSKQHIIVCLAMALREIYDPSVSVIVSPGGVSNARDSFSAARCVSVSVSPPSTALRGASRSPSATQQQIFDLATGRNGSVSPETDQGVSPTSGSPRSPSCVLAEVNASPACAPPPPLAICLRDETSARPAEAREKSSNPKGQEGRDSVSHDESMGETEERYVASNDFGVRAENARLREILDAKDKMILAQQNQLLGVVPSLIERVESSCSSHSASSSTGHHSRDSSVAPQRSLAGDASEEPQLRDALQVAQEERMQWKRTACELTAENKALRRQLRGERATCARLQADIAHLKKQWLTAKANGRIDSAPLSLAVSSISGSQSHERSEGDELNESHGVGGGLDETLPGSNHSSAQTATQQQEPQKHAKEQDEEEFLIAGSSSAALRAKRSALFAKLRRAPAESGDLSDPLVVVSPLTEERRPLRASGSPATERRLSPEYSSPPHCDTPITAVPAEEVSRILSSARSLLRSLRHGRRSGDLATAHKTSMDSGSERTSRTHSSSSNASRWSNESAGITHNHPTAVESNAFPLGAIRSDENAVKVPGRSRSPANGALSPCSSVSYSAAKQRGTQCGSNETSASMLNSTRENATPQKPTTPAPQQQQQTKKQKASLEPEQQHHQKAEDRQPTDGSVDGGRKAIEAKAKARPGRAREALMRELREQLSLLRSQRADVLSQAEQLRVKRQQVTAAFQRRIQDGVDGRGGDAAKLREKLRSYLVRFDTTQSKVRQNEARIRESAEIVERQLQTLEDDLL